MTAYQLEQSFRVSCEEHAKTLPSDVPLIKNIAAVGALDGTFGGTGRDSQFLTTMMQYLQHSGVAFDPDFEIDVVNFKENRDFFKEDNPIDLLFVAFIIREHIMRVTRTFSKKQENGDPSEENINKLSITLSPDHREARWDAHARERGAKVILTHGGTYEINTRSFTSYPSVIETPNFLGLTEQKESMSLAEQFGRSVDYPTGWFGVCADEDYLAQVRPHLGTTDFAKDARRSRVARIG